MQQVSKQLIKGLPRRIALMLLDCGLIVLCYWLAVMLRFDSGDAYRRVEILRAMAPMLLYVLPIYMIVFWFGGLYEIMWEYAGMRDLARLTCRSGLPEPDPLGKALASSRTSRELSQGVAVLDRSLIFLQGNVSPGAVCGDLVWQLQ